MLQVLRFLRWQDVLDILIVAALIYYVILLLKGTRSFQMMVGLFMVFVASIFSQKLNLYTLSWILDSFTSSIILVIVVIFQNEIRRVLVYMGENPIHHRKSDFIKKTYIMEEIIRACYYLAERKIGALIAIERRTSLQGYAYTGVPIGSKVSRELLISIFNPQSPLHDGAVLISGDKIIAASCILPLSMQMGLREMGTRHRAAIGLSEETDAVVIVVSEEKGAVSIALGGKLTRDLTQDRLRLVLQRLLAHEKKEKRVLSDVFDRIFGRKT